MLEGKPTPAGGSSYAAAGYSYSGDLARFVRDRWRDVPAALETPGGVDPLPDAAALEGFFTAGYQASMLREEERPVVFRAILAEPALFDPDGRPPEGLQRLELPSPRPFDPSIAARSAKASRQPCPPHAHFDPSTSTRVWPISPAPPSAPRWSSPLTITAPPTPQFATT
jgi:hypothetical protein